MLAVSEAKLETLPLAFFGLPAPSASTDTLRDNSGNILALSCSSRKTRASFWAACLRARSARKTCILHHTVCSCASYRPRRPFPGFWQTAEIPNFAWAASSAPPHGGAPPTIPSVRLLLPEFAPQLSYRRSNDFASVFRTLRVTRKETPIHERTLSRPRPDP